MTEPIYHLARAADWQAAQASGRYTVASLTTEGFIHCSTAAQVEATARRHYLGSTDLVLLTLDPERLGAAVRWERGTDVDDVFPHVYGPIPTSAGADARAFDGQ